MTPVEVTATPHGTLNEAVVPKPFKDEAALLPAKVVTIPELVTRRNRLFPASAMIKFPA